MRVELIEELVAKIESCDRAGLSETAVVLADRDRTAEGRVGEWVARSRSRRLRSRAGCRSVHRVVELVQSRCSETGLSDDDPAASVRLARAAREAARAIESGLVPPAVVAHMVAPFGLGPEPAPAGTSPAGTSPA